MIYLTLYFEFFKIGLFSVGGGLATLPLLQELIHKYGWITEDQLLNMIAISESTPGPIGVNTATFVGYQVAHIPGAVIATLGIVTPSVLVIVLLTGWLRRYKDHPVLNSAFSGVRPAVGGLIGAVALDLGKSELQIAGLQGTAINLKAVILFIVVLFVLTRFRAHPVVFLAAAAVVGALFRL